jgi:hypothetical protein
LKFKISVETGSAHALPMAKIEKNVLVKVALI